MSTTPQQEEPLTLGRAAERFVIVGRGKGYPALEDIGLYVPAGREAWFHWLTWRYTAASRGDRAAAAELGRAIRLGEAYVRPPDEEADTRQYVRKAS